MNSRFVRFLLYANVLILGLCAHGLESSDQKNQRECEGHLSRFQTRFLTDDVTSLREPVVQEIQRLSSTPETDFWLKTLFILKREQAGFSTVYFLPRGDQRLTEQEKARVFAAHPEDKFHRPATEAEWTQFYWNHLQGQIRFVAKQFKESLVRAVDPQLDIKADRAFDAVLMPTVIEDCAIDEARILKEIDLITPENLRSAQTRRRIEIETLGPKACCKTPGGCYDCFHNRRHLKPRGE